METTNNTNDFTVNFSVSPLTVDNFNYTYAHQGWQCPLCGRVYSPDTMMCPYCGQIETVTTTDFNNDNLFWKNEPEDFVTTSYNFLKQQKAIKLFLARKDKKEVMEAMGFPYNGGETLETNMTAFIKRMELNNQITELYNYLTDNKE